MSVPYHTSSLPSLPPARHLHVSNLVPCQKKSPLSSSLVFFISTSYHRIPNLAQLVAFSKQVFTIIASTIVKPHNRVFNSNPTPAHK